MAVFPDDAHFLVDNLRIRKVRCTLGVTNPPRCGGIRHSDWIGRTSGTPHECHFEGRVTPLEITPQEAAHRYGEAFARAFAVFVEELAGTDTCRKTGYGEDTNHPSDDWTYVEEDDEALARELAQAIKENDALAKAGKLDTFEVTDESASKAIADRLRWIIRDRGLTQKALAKRVGVTPARISQVLRNPDRSKVDTLRKIAQALDIDLRQIF